MDYLPADNPSGNLGATPDGSDVASAVAVSPAAYEDRSTGLMIFGVLEIIGGALILLLIPLMLLGLFIGRRTGGGPPLSSFVTLPLTYLSIAVALLALGIGATQAKRWAWALNLILSWIWVVLGALVTLMLVFLLPGSVLAGMRAAAARTPNASTPSPGVMAVLLTVIISVVAIFLIVLPIAFLLFYRSKNVELTCKHRDAKECWTDRIPLPLIAYGLLASFGAAHYFLTSFARPVFPLFGKYVTGVPAGVVLLAFAVLNVFIAVSFFRTKIVGWWVAVVSVGVQIISTVMTVSARNLLQAYSRLGWSPSQLETMSRSPMLHGPGLLVWTLALTIPYFVFLLWTKRYFRAPSAPSYTETVGPMASQTASGS